MTEFPLNWVGRNSTSPDPAEQLQLLGLTPTVTRHPLKPIEWTAALAEIARQMATGLTQIPAHIPLAHLSEDECRTLEGFLGEGEVVGHCLQSHHRTVESVLPGVWIVKNETTRWLEIGEIPTFVREAAQRRSSPPPLPSPPPNLMNAPALIAEIYDKARRYQFGAPNEVLTLSLFPLNEADTAYLPIALGEIGLELQSRGFGHCRIVATATPNTWAVQYLNGMGKVILDTLEIGDVPIATRAAAEDFVDSATRLAEILEAYE